MVQFIEAKHKRVFTWYRIGARWCTGIDLHHYRDYQETQKVTGNRVWLLFLHRSSVPDPIDSKHECCPRECPTGLFGRPLDYLVKHESHTSGRYGRHGMVYWAHDVLKPPLATLEEIERLLRDAA